MSEEIRVGIAVNKEEERHVNTVNREHPESHERIVCIMKRLEEEGLLERCRVIEKIEQCDESELRVTHTREYVEGVKAIEGKSQEEINEWSAPFDSVFATKESYRAALSAVACTRTLAEMIVRREIDCAFSIVRPPGHHADSDNPCGFCLFNNVAQAVDAARLAGIERVLIVDLDVHHGQGTQRIFYDDDNVLYFSIHRHECGMFWPNLEESGSSYIGEGAGKGRTVNVPLQETECGDGDYLFVLFSLLLPVARDFNPQLVIVSAGFDSLGGDPLGRMEVTPIGYSHIIHHLTILASGNILLVLEGGYHHAMTAEGVTECVRVLLDSRPLTLPALSPPKQSTRESVLNTISYLIDLWPSLGVYDKNELIRKGYPSKSATMYRTPDKDIPTGNIRQEELRAVKKGGSGREGRGVLVTHTNDLHRLHCSTSSFETPERVEKPLQRLIFNVSDQLVVKQVEEKDIPDIQYLLESVHDAEYLEMLRLTEFKDQNVLDEEWKDSSCYVTKGTYRAVREAACATVKAVDSVVSGEYSSAFALVRPPGHHASRREASGFCFINNVVVAVKRATERGLRVAVVDVDVHLGDGTMEGLWEGTLFLDIHRYDDKLFFPYKQHATCKRNDTVRPLKVLIGWNDSGMGDAEYTSALYSSVLPIIYSFNPQLILLSTGMDCLKGDPLGQYQVSPRILSLFIHHLQAVAPVVAVLEGGYDIDTVCSGVDAVLMGMMGIFKEGPTTERLNPDAAITLRTVINECRGQFRLLI